MGVNNAEKTNVPVFEVRHLYKRFGDVVANNDINLHLYKSEILSIIGENGAGKSTFCKMLTGLYIPDEGDILLDGEKVSFESPIDSVRKGVSMVYQERNLVGMLTGAQNICLGNEPCKNGYLSEKLAMEKASAIRKKLNLENVPLDVPVEKMGTGMQQLIEIMRAFYTDPKVLILDEPTASLGKGEIEPFLDFLKNIRKNTDVSIIFISHKIEEVFDISDRIAVFTDGVNVLTDEIENVTQEDCIQAMLRQNKLKPIVVPEKDFNSLEPVLKVQTGTYDNKVHDIQFEARRGEVVGFYGLVGSGRTECIEYIYGLRRADKREFEFCGETLTKGTPYEMIKRGMIFTPEKRANGIFRSLSLVDNISNLFLEKYSNKVTGKVDFKATRKFSIDVLKKNMVKHRSPDQAIGELSGGNMQKLIIGRSVEVENISLLVVDEPTTGMDVGAKHDVYLKLRDLADRTNIAVIFISSELEELLNTCDRLYVFANGDVVSEFARKDFDKSLILETAIRGRKV